MGLTDLVFHIDDHLVTIMNMLGNWIYLILSAIIFAETGLVVSPFPPGDSPIFACCAMVATPKYNLHFWVCYLIFIAAAALGDMTNYEIGHWPQTEGTKHSRFNKLINQDKRKTAENSFDWHGGITIAIGRFIPPIHMFAPLVPGASRMHYRTFIICGFIGGFLRVTLFSTLRFFFGNIPIAQGHFSLIVIAITLISALLALIIWLKKKLALKKELR